MSEFLRLDQVRSDGGTQSRAGLDMDVVTDYAEQMEDGAQFPPIIVFYDGTVYWLADGFHRLEARRFGGMTNISADVRQGDRLAALRYSLGANDKHGLPRNSQDYRRAYQCGVDNGLCKHDDTAEVQKLLKCSRRWAQSLTREAREESKTERDRKIAELAAEGKTQREIAAEVAVDVATVNRSVAKRNSAEMQQPTPSDESDDDEDALTPVEALRYASEDELIELGEQAYMKQWEEEHSTQTEEQVMPKLKVTDEHLNQDGNPFSAKAIYYVIRDQMKRIRYSDPNAPEVLRKIITQAQQILSTIEKGEAA